MQDLPVGCGTDVDGSGSNPAILHTDRTSYDEGESIARSVTHRTRAMGHLVKTCCWFSLCRRARSVFKPVALFEREKATAAEADLFETGRNRLIWG